ncbi:MAG: hypothetical protein ACOX52_16975 [Verrucomicrobiota bacterium]
MPAVVNPGPVATRITFFAPVSLLFFFTVLLIMSIVRGAGLHPMNYFFLAAGCFAFQLLFAYLVDLVPTMAAFSIAAVVSLLLVNGYLAAVAGFRFARLSSTAQFGFMVALQLQLLLPRPDRPHHHHRRDPNPGTPHASHRQNRLEPNLRRLTPQPPVPFCTSASCSVLCVHACVHEVTSRSNFTK